MTDIPTVVAHEVRPNRTYPGSLLATIRCPYCGKEHTHGVPQEFIGEERHHRVSHCARAPHYGDHGYYFTLPQ